MKKSRGLSRRNRFMFAHYFSIGLQSGEYGDRNNIRTLPHAGFFSAFLRWRLALSRIAVYPCPWGNAGRKTFPNHCSNEAALVECP